MPFLRDQIELFLAFSSHFNSCVRVSDGKEEDVFAFVFSIMFCVWEIEFFVCNKFDYDWLKALGPNSNRMMITANTMWCLIPSKIFWMRLDAANNANIEPCPKRSPQTVFQCCNDDERTPLSQIENPFYSVPYTKTHSIVRSSILLTDQSKEFNSLHEMSTEN